MKPNDEIKLLKK